MVSRRRHLHCLCRLLRLDKEGIIEKLIVCQLRHQLVRFLKCSRQAQTSIQHFDQVLPHVAVHLYHAGSSGERCLARIGMRVAGEEACSNWFYALQAYDERFKHV